MKKRLVGLITAMLVVVLIGGCSTNMKENVVYKNEGYDQLAVYFVDGIDIASLTKEEWEQQLKAENIVESKHSSARSWRNK